MMLSAVFKRFTSTIQTLSTKQLTSPSSIPFVESSPFLVNKSPEARRIRKRLLSRPGLIAKKRGMTCFYTNVGKKLPATILEVEQLEVTYNKTLEKNGYFAVQLGYGYKPKNQTKSMLGHYRNAEVSPKEKLFEFEVKDESGLLPLGSELKADQFKIGQFVDVISKSKGKGFSGVMKRWNFHGLKASHGVSLAHRSAGSTGQNTSPGRVLPGKKMAGRLGHDYVTLSNLLVLDVNAEKGYLLVKGGVSGARGSFVKVRDSLKKYGSHLSVTHKNITK